MAGRGKRRSAGGMPDVKIRLPRDLLERAWTRATKEGHSLSWLLRKLIAEGLEKPEVTGTSPRKETR